VIHEITLAALTLKGNLKMNRSIDLLQVVSLAIGMLCTSAIMGQPSSKDSQQLKLPALPIEITSFGAAKLANSIYVYGGHTGNAHSYSNQAQNNKLLCLDLENTGAGWKELATGERLQGLGMVARDNQLIIIGGFTALNAEGEKQKLSSQSNVRAFDVKTNQWSELPSLPEPRSSFDAALIGNTVFVVGGWNMQADGKPKWHTTALSMDLKSSKPVWTEIAKPPFVRRAVAAISHAGKLFVIGGMNEKGVPTKEVALYDPNGNTWTEVAEIHGEESMAGFGASGWSLDGRLIVTTYEGAVEYWNDSLQAWELKGKTRDARFFHRVLPVDEQRLVSIGGANMEIGKFAELELLQIK
jgi:N-acetylneuraminic acid mutarotase